MWHNKTTNHFVLDILPQLVLCLLLATIAIQLNQYFYSRYGPFYDSMGYYTQLAKVMASVKVNGLFSTLQNQALASTVFFPWLIAAFLGVFIEPARATGIVIQIILVFLQLNAAYRLFYFSTKNRLKSYVFSLPFIVYPAIFNFNGGLSDFRMDLGQTLAFGAFLGAIILARLKDSTFEWWIAGVMLGITGLVRATTPVYVVMFLGFVFLFDIVKGNIKKTLLNYLIMSCTAITICGWFYVTNYERLYHYYFVWNTDANARLPWAIAVNHLSLLYGHLGLYFVILLVLNVLTQIRHIAVNPRAFNFLALLGAMIPISYLVLSGAGLNPFVSMIAVPGLLYFGLLPVVSAKKQIWCTRDLLMMLMVLLLMTLSVFNSIRNYENLVSDWIPETLGLNKITDTILCDAGVRPAKIIRISFLFQGSVDGNTLKNQMIFDYKFKINNDQTLAGVINHSVCQESQKGTFADAVSIANIVYGLGAETDWKKIPGGTSAEKVDHLVTSAIQHDDYIVVATAQSDLPAHHEVNGFAQQIESQVQHDPHTRLIRSDIKISKNQTVSIFGTK